MDVVATINPIFPAILATIHDFSLTYNPPARKDVPARVRNPLTPPSFGGEEGIVNWSMVLVDGSVVGSRWRSEADEECGRSRAAVD